MKKLAYFLACLLILQNLSCYKITIGGGDDKKKKSSSTRYRSSAKSSDRTSETQTYSQTAARQTRTAARQNAGGKSFADIAAEVAGNVFLGTDQGAIFYSFDALAEPNESIQLTVRLQDSKLRGVADAQIGYYLKDARVGIARTNQDGLAQLKWKSLSTGNYDFTAQILSPPAGKDPKLKQVIPVPLFVMVRKSDTQFVVIDLDHTLVDSSFFKVLMGLGRPMADSQRVTKQIAKKYSILYLTHRPDLMTHRSKGWLRQQGYPLGALLVSKMSQALGNSGKYKTARLTELKESFPNIKIGIGDKITDAQSYLENGLESYLIPHYNDDDPEDLRDMAREIRLLTIYGPVQVVGNWQQIERGIFEGKKYPAERFARWLDDQAKLYEQVERRKKRD
jgi:hypothetical protein